MLRKNLGRRKLEEFFMTAKGMKATLTSPSAYVAMYPYARTRIAGRKRQNRIAFQSTAFRLKSLTRKYSPTAGSRQMVKLGFISDETTTAKAQVIA